MAGEGNIGIGNVMEGVKNIHISINDVTGRILYDGSIDRKGSLFIVPYNLWREKYNCVFISIESVSGIATKKIIIE